MTGCLAQRQLPAQRIGIDVNAADQDLQRSAVQRRQRLAQAALVEGKKLVEDLEPADPGRQLVPGQVGDVRVELPRARGARRSAAPGLLCTTAPSGSISHRPASRTPHSSGSASVTCSPRSRMLCSPAHARLNQS